MLGLFSFLNSQNVSIQSSLDVISETGKGSLSASPPGLPNIDLKSALNSGADTGSPAADSGSISPAADPGSSRVSSGSGSLIADSGSSGGGAAVGSGSSGSTSGGGAAVGSGSSGSTSGGGAAVGSGSTATVSSSAGSTVTNGGSGSSTNSIGSNSAGSGAGATESSNPTGNAFGVFGTIDTNLFSGSGSANVNSNPRGLGAVVQNPGASDLDALLTDNDFQLDLIADDSRVAQNSFLSSTDPTVIRAGNIAGNSGPEVYMVLIISLMFAGFLTIKTT